MMMNCILCNFRRFEGFLNIDCLLVRIRYGIGNILDLMELGDMMGIFTVIVEICVMIVNFAIFDDFQTKFLII